MGRAPAAEPERGAHGTRAPRALTVEVRAEFGIPTNRIGPEFSAA
jgi:hypothetical protein